MRYDPDRHHRQSTRLRGFDYAHAGAYFVTICVQDRECLFGDVVDRALRLNAAGRMVLAQWLDLPMRYTNVGADVCVVMPNHFHGIVMLHGGNAAVESRAATRAAPTKTSRDLNDMSSVGAPLVGALPLPFVPRETSRHVHDASPVGAPLVGALPLLVGARHAPTPTPTPTLGTVIGAFKSLTTLLYTREVIAGNWPAYRGRLWQRGFHDEIIRDDAALAQIRRYIEDNPAQWADDREHPAFDDLTARGGVSR